MSEEFELKLRMSPERLEQLRRSALLRSLARERAVTRHFTTVYFDTPDRALQQRGIALRIRQIGDRRIQTVKVPLGEVGAVHAHRELETDVDSDTPQLHQVADDELREFLTRPEIADALQPVFSSEFERTAVPVKLFDSEIEVALDHGEIGAGGRSAPLNEAELELKTGRRERLYELAIALNEAIPVSLEAETKAARGYRLAAERGAGFLPRWAGRTCGRHDGARRFRRDRQECAGAIAPERGLRPDRRGYRRRASAARRHPPPAVADLRLQGHDDRRYARLSHSRAEMAAGRARTGAGLGCLYPRDAGADAATPSRRSDAARTAG